MKETFWKEQNDKSVDAFVSVQLSGKLLPLQSILKRVPCVLEEAFSDVSQ